jgi:CheY-like chemotaxis protein
VVLVADPERPEQPGAGEYVLVSVTDTGSGIPPEIQAKVFEPFFTTKEVGKGSGLGLSQVLGFVKQSGGGMCIDSVEGEGASVKIYLPRAAALAPAVQADGGEFDHKPRATPIEGRMPELLLVDDDSAVREVTCAMLRELGYLVTEAGSGRQALDILTGHPPFDLLLIDYAMPGMNGGELAQRVRQGAPGQTILFITGYADFAALSALGQDRVVQKPFRDGDLARQVSAALGIQDKSAKVVQIKRG